MNVAAKWCWLGHLLNCLVCDLSGKHHHVQGQLVGACVGLNHLQCSAVQARHIVDGIVAGVSAVTLLPPLLHSHTCN